MLFLKLLFYSTYLLLPCYCGNNIHWQTREIESNESKINQSLLFWAYSTSSVQRKTTKEKFVRNFHTIKGWRVSQKLSKSHFFYKFSVDWLDFKNSHSFMLSKFLMRVFRCTEEVQYNPSALSLKVGAQDPPSMKPPNHVPLVCVLSWRNVEVLCEGISDVITFR